MGEQSLEGVLDDTAVRRLRDLLGERTDTVVTIGDPAGRLLWASVPGSRELFGHSPATVPGASRFDHVHPDDQARARRQFARALEGETVQYSVRVRTAASTWRRVSSVAWVVQGRWGTAVVTITTWDGEAPLAWPRTAQR